MEDELECQVSANVGPRWGGAATIGLMVGSRPGCRPGGTEAGKWWWLHSTSLYFTLLYCTQHYRGGQDAVGEEMTPRGKPDLVVPWHLGASDWHHQGPSI